MKRLRTIAIAVAVSGGTLLAAGSAPGADGTPLPSADAPIVVGIGEGGGPYVTAYDRSGAWRAGFLAYYDFSVGGVHVAAGDVDGDGAAEIVTVPGRGGRGEIRTFDASGDRMDPTAFATSSGCGTRIAVGDVNGDKKADLVAGFEQCHPDIQVFDGATGERIAYFGTGQSDNGIRVAAGDVDGNGRDEIVTGAGPGDPPTVRVFPGTPASFSPAPLRTFDAFGSSVTNGVEVASADTNADGKADVIAGAETPDDPQIKVFDGSTGTLRATFRPFGLVTAGSFRIAAGDVDGDGNPEIVAGATINYSPVIRIFSADGKQLAELQAPMYNGRSLAAGDVDGDGKAEIEMSAGPGHDSSVVVFDASAAVETWFQAYGYSFTNGVRVAAGDLDGNGTVEYVTGQGPGGGSELLVLDAHGNELHELYPFGEGWQGLYVAAGDVDGDLRADIVAGAGSWTEPRIKVYGGSGAEKASFLAFDPGFRGGVRVATGDLDGDGKAEIVAGAGPGGPPVVRVFDSTGRRTASFFAFDPSSTSGIYIAAGDLDGDGKAEIVAGAGNTGEVRVFSSAGALRTSFTAYEQTQEYYDGVHVAVGDVNGDGTSEIATGPGRVRPVDVSIFTGDGERIGGFRAHDEFQGGIFVAVPPALGPRLELSVPEVRRVEGQTATIRGSVVDPRGGAAPEQFAATVHWDHGAESSTPVAALGGGRYRFEVARTYFTYGRYRIDVRVADIHLRGAVATTLVKVSDAPLHASGRAIRTKGMRFAGVIGSLRDENPLGTALDLKTRVLWGDGRHSRARLNMTGNGRFQILGQHHFAKPGVYRVVVQIRSLGGSRATARASIRVTG